MVSQLSGSMPPNSTVRQVRQYVIRRGAICKTDLTERQEEQILVFKNLVKRRNGIMIRIKGHELMTQVKGHEQPWKYDEEGNKEPFKFTFPNLKWLQEVGMEMEFLPDERGFLGQLLKHLAAETTNLKKQLRRIGKKFDNNRLWVHKYQELYAKQLAKRKEIGIKYKEMREQFEILQDRIEKDVYEKESK